MAGTILERSGSRIFNTALAFGPDGSLVARHRKLMPWKPCESSDPGRGREPFSTFDIPGVGRFGLMICCEGWFPEIPRTLAWMGAKVILKPTLTMTVGPAPGAGARSSLPTPRFVADFAAVPDRRPPTMSV